MQKQSKTMFLWMWPSWLHFFKKKYTKHPMKSFIALYFTQRAHSENLDIFLFTLKINRTQVSWIKMYTIKNEKNVKINNEFGGRVMFICHFICRNINVSDLLVIFHWILNHTSSRCDFYVNNGPSTEYAMFIMWKFNKFFKAENIFGSDVFGNIQSICGI